MNDKLYAVLEKVAKNKAGYVILYVIYQINEFFKKCRNYFVKDAEISVTYVSWLNDSGEYQRTPDSFNVYITSKGHCESLFSNIDFSEASRLLDLLKKDNKAVLLECSVGLGTSSVKIPPWAKQMLIEQLEKIIGETKDSRERYEKWMEESDDEQRDI